MVTLVNLLQFQKADSPILVTLFGIVTLVKLLQPQNARFSMLVTPSRIVASVKFLQSLKVTSKNHY